MPIYDITGPNGQLYSIEGPEGATREQVINAIQSRLSAEKNKPKEDATAGIGEAIVGGGKQLLSSMGTALNILDTPEEAAIKGVRRQEGFKEKPPASLDEVKRVYNEEGLFPAAKEAVSQIPSAVAAQSPYLASMYAGAKSFAALAPLPLKGYAALAGSMIVPFISFIGSNMERKAAEQMQAGQPVDVNRLQSAGTAVVQTGLERASLGLSGLSKVMGINLLKPKPRDVEKIARENLALAAVKGVGIFAGVEIPTEIGQQALERMYAGLSLTDESAIKEYSETAFQTALTGPIGVITGVSEVSSARTEVRETEEEKQRKLTIVRREAHNALKRRQLIAAELKDEAELAAEKADAEFLAQNSVNSLGNKAPEKSKLSTLISQAQKAFDVAVANNDKEAQQKAINSLVNVPNNIIALAEQKTTPLGKLDEATLTSFGLSPLSKAFKRLKGLNIDNPKNIVLFESTLEKHAGKINEEAINTYLSKLTEKANGTNRSRNKGPAVSNKLPEQRTDLGPIGTAVEPQSSDGTGLGSNISDSTGSGRGETVLNAPLTKPPVTTAPAPKVAAPTGLTGIINNLKTQNATREVAPEVVP
jgi:hypothetical protein